MTNITIPPEAIEAAAIKLAEGRLPEYSWNDLDADMKEMYREDATAAIRAALAAWPGMGPIRTDQPIGDWCDKLPAIILPLPQEKTDE